MDSTDPKTGYTSRRHGISQRTTDYHYVGNPLVMLDITDFTGYNSERKRL